MEDEDGKKSECLFFSKWQKEQWQSFDFNQNVTIFENYNGLMC